MVDVGSDANFSCQSSIPNRISWSLIDLAGRSLALNATIVLQSITYVSILLSADQKTSTVTLHAVEKQFSGTIRCADTHQAAFADLTVLDTGQSGGLTLCPTDVVASSGDCVLMRVAGIPGSSLRWYRSLHDHPEVNSVIFTSEKMDYKQVDERYFVAASRDEEKSLLIRDVKSTDAAHFTVCEVFSGHSARVKLLVIEPDSFQCQRKTVSEVDVQFVCEVQYKGSIQPTMQWLLENNDELFNGTLHATDGKVESRLTVSGAHLSTWPIQCRITFHRQSCSEPRAAYRRIIQCPWGNSLTLSEIMWHLAGRPVIVAGILVAFVVSVAINTVIVAVCIHKCTSTKTKSTEPDEPDSTSVEYEKLRNPVTAEPHDLSPPQYERFVYEDNQYEEPVVT